MSVRSVVMAVVRDVVVEEALELVERPERSVMLEFGCRGGGGAHGW